MTSFIGTLAQESTPAIIADKLRQAIGHGELKPGAHISIFRALKKPDGTYAADRVSVGRDGIVP